MRIKVGLALALVGALVGAAGVGIAIGQDDPIAARQALMKSNGAQAGALNGMVKGDTPFDAAAAKAAFETIAQNMATFPTLFPAGSDTGNTKASPAIWTDMAGFQAAAAKLATDATAAAASVNTLEDLQASFATIGGDCGACHQKYRL